MGLFWVLAKLHFASLVLSSEVDFVGACVRPGRLVGHPVDCRVGHQVANELQFGGAGLGVVGGNGPHGAAVKVDPVVVVAGLLTVGEVSLFIEHVGQYVDSFGDGLACELVPRVFDEAASASLEYSIHEFWVFFFDVFEEFDGEAAVCRHEEWFGEVGGVIAVGWTSRLAAVLTRGDEAGGSQCSQVLANCAGGDLEGGGEFFGLILGRVIDMDGNATLHIDESLLRVLLAAEPFSPMLVQ